MWLRGLNERSVQPPRHESRRWLARGLFTFLAAGLMVVPGVVELQAQQGSITGLVREEGSGNALQGAQVTISELQRGVLAGAGGRFLLDGVPVGTHTVTVEYIGYATASQEIQVAAGETTLLDFNLRQQAFALDEIVVTGTAGVTERRQIGHSIGIVEAAELVEIAPITTVNQLLQGRIAGASILQQSGNIGRGTTMALRGISSVEMRSTPLFYIDGVRVTNNTARLNDLSPSDIESIEVVKGPAASTLYGSEASNGVVQIITKKGRSGQAQFTAQTRLGSQFWNDAEEWIPTNGARDPATGNVVLHHPLLAEEAAGRSVIFNGMTQSYNLDVTGGTGRLRLLRIALVPGRRRDHTQQLDRAARRPRERQRARQRRPADQRGHQLRQGGSWRGAGGIHRHARVLRPGDIRQSTDIEHDASRLPAVGAGRDLEGAPP